MRLLVKKHLALLGAMLDQLSKPDSIQIRGLHFLFNPVLCSVYYTEQNCDSGSLRSYTFMFRSSSSILPFASDWHMLYISI